MTTISFDQLVAIAQDGNVAVKPKDNLYRLDDHRPMWWKCEVACVVCCNEWLAATPQEKDGDWWQCPECRMMTGQVVKMLGDAPQTLPALLGMYSPS